MSHYKLLSVILLTLAFALISLAQDDTAASDSKNPKTTRLVNEFGRAVDCELSAHVDSLFIWLNDNPGAKGYVIAYKGTDFLPSQIKSSPMIARIRRSIAFRKYDESRVVFIDGGFRDTVNTQFYLVPDGAVPPEATDTVAAPEAPKGTFLWGDSWLQADDAYQDFGEFILPSVQAERDEEERLADLEQSLEPKSVEADGSLPETEPDDLQNDNAEANADDEPLTPAEIREMKFAWADLKFGDEIANRKKSHGVMIFYADDKYYDVSKLKRFVEEGRDIIAEASGLRPNQIQVVFGGYRDSEKVEYYVVPKGGKEPEPKPEERKVETPEVP